MSSSKWLEDTVLPLLDSGKRVLLVEGEDDQAVYEAWLAKLAGGPGSSRVPNVVPTTGKQTLLRHLKALSQPVEQGLVFGLVDRDEWEQTEVNRQLTDLPGLRVNPLRHCLESYFCEFEELRAALLNSGISTAATAVAAVKTAVGANLADWVGHWSLWTTLQRLLAQLGEAAFPNAFHQGLKLPADKVIKAKLGEWSGLVNVSKVMSDHRALKKGSLKRSQAEQVRSCVYAKNVFPQIVVVALNKLNAGIESDEWMPKLAAWSPQVPTDIATILQPLLA